MRELGSASNYAEFRLDLQTTPVPEPGTLALTVTGLALIGLGGLARHRRAAP